MFIIFGSFRASVISRRKYYRNIEEHGGNAMVYYKHVLTSIELIAF